MRSEKINHIHVHCNNTYVISQIVLIPVFTIYWYKHIILLNEYKWHIVGNSPQRPNIVSIDQHLRHYVL